MNSIRKPLTSVPSAIPEAHALYLGIERGVVRRRGNGQQFLSANPDPALGALARNAGAEGSRRLSVRRIAPAANRNEVLTELPQRLNLLLADGRAVPRHWRLDVATALVVLILYHIQSLVSSNG